MLLSIQRAKLFPSVINSLEWSELLGRKNTWNMHSGANSVSAVLKKCFTGRKQQQSAKEKAVPRAGTADGDSYGGYHFMPYGLFLNMILTYDYAEIKEIISATEEKQKIS